MTTEGSGIAFFYLAWIVTNSNVVFFVSVREPNSYSFFFQIKKDLRKKISTTTGSKAAFTLATRVTEPREQGRATSEPAIIVLRSTITFSVSKYSLSRCPRRSADP